MTATIAVFLLALVGIGETAYLVRKRVRMERPVCVIGSSCEAVLESKYNKLILGIPNDFLGLFLYLMIAGVAALILKDTAPLSVWTNALRIFIAAGSVASFVFSYIEWRIIKAWCFWCLMSASTLWLMGVIALFFRFA